MKPSSSPAFSLLRLLVLLCVGLYYWRGAVVPFGLRFRVPTFKHPPTGPFCPYQKQRIWAGTDLGVRSISSKGP
ncbi:hypothetical protein ACFX16_004217 [Malus domestica]